MELHIVPFPTNIGDEEAVQAVSLGEEGIRLLGSKTEEAAKEKDQIAGYPELLRGGPAKGTHKSRLEEGPGNL